MKILIQISILSIVQIQNIKQLNLQDVALHKNEKGEEQFNILQFTDLHQGESEEKDEKTDKLVKNLLENDNPSLVVVTGDIVSGKLGKGKPGWFEKYHRRFTKQFHQKGNFTFHSYYQMYTLGVEDLEADLSPQQIIALDQKNNLSMTDSMADDSTNYYIVVKYNKDVVAAIFMLDSRGTGCQDAMGYCGPSLEVAQWFNEQMAKITKLWKHIKVLVQLHTPVQETLLLQNNFKPRGTLNESDIGCSSLNSGLQNISRKYKDNVLGIFFGHDHDNDWEVKSHNILLSQGRKTGYGGKGGPHSRRGAKGVRLQLGHRTVLSDVGEATKQPKYVSRYETQIRDEDIKRVIEERDQEELSIKKQGTCQGSVLVEKEKGEEKEEGDHGKENRENNKSDKKAVDDQEIDNFPSRGNRSQDELDSFPSRPNNEDEDSFPSRPNNEDEDSFPSRPNNEDEDSFPSRPNNEDEDSFPSRPNNESEDSFPSRPNNESEDSFPSRPNNEDEDSFPSRPNNESEDSFPSRPNNDEDSFPSRPNNEDEDSFPSRPNNEDEDSFPSRPNNDEDSFPSRPNNEDEDLVKFNETQPLKNSNQLNDDVNLINNKSPNKDLYPKPKEENIIRIVCVGDSITEGVNSSDKSKFSYPSLLKDYIYSEQYEVINLGLSGRTMLKISDSSYWNEENYQIAQKSKADIIILMLGTNDSKINIWNEENYITDQIEMSRSFLNMPSNPKLQIMIPPPLQRGGVMQQSVVNERLPIIIPNIASELGLSSDHVIDLFEALGGNSLNKWQQQSSGRNLNDPVHPNDLGQSVIAGMVYKHLFAMENPFEGNL